MDEALKYCDCKTPTDRQVTVRQAQFRTATILHRRAVMHHDAMRNEVFNGDCVVSAATSARISGRLGKDELFQLLFDTIAS